VGTLRRHVGNSASSKPRFQINREASSRRRAGRNDPFGRATERSWLIPGGDIDVWRWDGVDALLSRDPLPDCSVRDFERLLLEWRIRNGDLFVGPLGGLHGEHACACNGTRLIVEDVKKNVLVCHIVTGRKERIGTRVIIPRIKLHSAKGELPCTRSHVCSFLCASRLA
jgi:hypothetical protein